MPLDPQSYAEPEVAVAAVVVGVAASPPLRRTLRRSLVYGLAGALLAYDKASEVAQGVAKGVQRGVKTIRPEPTETPANPADQTAAPPPPQS